MHKSVKRKQTQKTQHISDLSRNKFIWLV